MIESALLRWILTALFALTAIWFMRRAVRAGAGAPERISAMAHVLMSALMVPMAWPWGMTIPAFPQIVLLSLAGLWFLGLAVKKSWPRVEAEPGGRWASLHHAAMMVAMVWMLATMPELMAATSHDPGSGGHHAVGAGASATMVAGTMPAELPVWITIVTVVLGGYLILSSMSWLAAAVDRGRGATGASTTGFDIVESVALSWAGHGAMSIGMGVMLLAALPV